MEINTKRKMVVKLTASYGFIRRSTSKITVKNSSSLWSPVAFVPNHMAAVYLV